MRLANTVALISGVRGPIARAIAEGYAREGATLVVGDEDSDAAERVAARIRELDAKVLPVAVDVTKKAEVEQLVQRCVSTFGRIDVLVNATGVAHNQAFLTFREEDFDHCLAVGLKAYFLTCQVVGRQMAQQGGGRIINLSSVVGRLGSGEAASWCAARAGVDAMTRAIAQALGYYGINVNALVHGGMEEFSYEEEERAERRRRIPFGRLGRPGDLVGAAIFLATEDSNFVAGENLYVDGGYTTAAVTEDPFRPEWARREHTERGPRTDRYVR